ncbi:holo-ACP synthase [Nitrospirillum pindoramense]|uniref:Holo-[acyl-carrier-protein] synthase n=1 Tax=Nitrospirillum amazonense TaxID=28077 RepID=A0A560HEN0_9PROT|nr:holo-[acyl-carrier protein] synthase [Nitrospirillum amazonense]
MMGAAFQPGALILGIGNDLIDITRIEKTLARFGQRFVERVFTDVEQAKSERRAKSNGRAASYAKRFAAKEACSKALGTGFREGVFHKDMGVINLPSGQPTLCLTGGALERLRAMTPPGMVAQIFLTLTDEPPLAEAFVIITATPVPAGGVANGIA